VGHESVHMARLTKIQNPKLVLLHRAWPTTVNRMASITVVLKTGHTSGLHQAAH
jgi:hypothetical protein